MPASIPARPVPEMANVRGFTVRNTWRPNSITSVMIAVNAGSNCPSTGAPIACSTLGSGLVGPVPHSSRTGGLNSPIRCDIATPPIEKL